MSAAPFGVNVVGYVSARLGLGVAARASVAALAAAGVPVAVVDVVLPDGRSNADVTWAHLNITDTASLPHPVNLVHLNPFEARNIRSQFPQWFAAATNIVVPFFELMDIPNDWLAPISRYDAVFAPTQHIAAAVLGSVDVPVRHYPMAADVGEVRPAPREAYGIPRDRFVFATTFDTDSGLKRKNGIGLLRAFAAAFEGRTDVALFVKVNGILRHPELERIIATMSPGSVILFDRYLPYGELLGVYAACDAFVSLHRAEGLGLGLMEAMLLGRPVIATGWSGNMDFMDDASAALVNYSYTPVFDTQPAYDPGSFARRQLWAEPDVLHAIQVLRRIAADAVYRDKLATTGKARALARREAFFGGGAADRIKSFWEARKG